MTTPTLPIELRGIKETAAQGGGFWRSCSGCHELNEGHDTGPISQVLGCALGVGCSECGGIGAIWDTTDYEAMADFMSRPTQDDEALAAQPELPEPVGTAAELTGSRGGFTHAVFQSAAVPVGTLLYTAAQLQQAVARASAPQGVPQSKRTISDAKKFADAVRSGWVPLLPADEARLAELLDLLAAAPQKAKDCGCEACKPNSIRMIVCANCGNKRCPHATDHRNACTNSNEPGQKGSSYEHAGFGSATPQPVAQTVPPEPSDEDIDAVFNAMPDGMNGWLKSWGYRHFARSLLQRYGGHGLTDDLVWCDCGDGYAKGTDDAVFIASGHNCQNCQATTGAQLDQVKVGTQAHFDFQDIEVYLEEAGHKHDGDAISKLKDLRKNFNGLVAQFGLDIENAERWKFFMDLLDGIGDEDDPAAKGFPESIHSAFMCGSAATIVAIDAAMAAQKGQA